MSYHLAGCCSPLKGDSIVGIVTAGIGVAVHTLDCDTLSSYQDAPDRWLNISWNNQNNLDNEFLMHVIDQIDLDKFMNQKAGLLSHGQKQWLEIGMLLAQEAELLMLDEPVAGMTDEERVRTSELLKVISKEKTVIVIEHDMDFVESLNCPVTVQNDGTV